MSKKPTILLISPYDIGRQPFALAQTSAWLKEAEFTVSCLDLSIQKLDDRQLQNADIIGLYLGMHTATRIALQALPKITQQTNAILFAFGLYAPLNQAALKNNGVDYFFAGESEPDIVELAKQLSSDKKPLPNAPLIRTNKIDFKLPDRTNLPTISKYAQLVQENEKQKILGFIETSRGCKYVCRHCPVTPIYEGKFRIVPLNIVMQDIAQQVDMGAEHISFGDPDFFNGPTHAKKVIIAMHELYPTLSFDATIKIEHILNHADLLPIMKDTGCLFITCAVESFDDDILLKLDKGHTRADTFKAVALINQAGLSISPTFVPFSPWATLEGYRDLLQDIISLNLINEVTPIQLGIRLLIPNGSYLLKLPNFDTLIGEFDTEKLGFPWQHIDPKVDALQTIIMAIIERADNQNQTRHDTFLDIWKATHQTLGINAPSLPAFKTKQVPHLTETWYCCAEPTDELINNF